MIDKRIVIASLAVFVFVFFFEWLLHGVCFLDLYKQTAMLWRSESEMPTFLGWRIAGQLLFSFTFTLIFSKGYENKGLLEGFRYGILISLLYIANHLLMYSVQPLPPKLLVYWIVGVVIELVLAGILLTKVYKKA